MLQGPALGAAIASAMEKKADHVGVKKITQADLAKALGITQPSVSELLKLGRLSKEKLPKLLEYFGDVVGPDHFGLPFSKFEMEFLHELRSLPPYAQAALLTRVRSAAERVSDATSALDAPISGDSGKPQAEAA